MPDYQTLVVTPENDGILLIKLNRPERKNALSATLVRELQTAFLAFAADDQSRVAVLAASGTTFSSGADVNEWPEVWRCMPNLGFQTDKPIVAAVSGWCIGAALTMVMLCDLLVAAENTKFLYPEGKLGFVGGMVAGLAGRVSHHAAMEIMLLGRPLAAQRAYDLGFVNEISAEGEHLDAALRMARELTRLSPVVLQTLKRFVNEHVLPQGPAEQMVRTMRRLKAVEQGDDFKEGIAAFKEKRPPVYAWPARWVEA